MPTKSSFIKGNKVLNRNEEKFPLDEYLDEYTINHKLYIAKNILIENENILLNKVYIILLLGYI